MKGLSEKTWTIVQKMFPYDQCEEVGQLLVAECGNNLPGFHKSNEEELERVRFAVLRLSKGHLDELPLVIIGAQTDWRDTLMAAGFGHSVSEHEIWANGYLAAVSQDIDDEPMEATVYQENWVKCPKCGGRFCLNNISSWSGERHRKCGQRLKFKTS